MQKTIIERAYELAGSGEFPTITALKKALKADGFNAADIEGMSFSRTLMSDLKKLCKDGPREVFAGRE